MTEEEEAAFEREHDIAVNAGGSVVVAAWGMGLAILFVAIAFSAFLLSYFYLRLENPTWPPQGVPDPQLWPAAVGAGLVALSGVAMQWSLGRVRRAEPSGFARGLAVVLALAVAGAVVQVSDVAGTPFGATDHAYGAIYHTLAGFVLTVAAIAALMVGMVLFWTLRGLYTHRRHATVAHVARFWIAMIVVWVIGFGALALGPRLT